ncbi:hypothetical protein BOTBODRAFT_503797 [Botryobasidium botryosum FD-172 SS1]|uniref:Uncharacterized protein n=1 Tax=Botryobasidium botryosum (strain FD-172 SS1) TaxID=930990 RepID=A0A067M371_BOTB1|nr:hypothetical protein BOTBODRAFT_503797 [Botryobasidium botryosum FD-172 SS1]
MKTNCRAATISLRPKHIEAPESINPTKLNVDETLSPSRHSSSSYPKLFNSMLIAMGICGLPIFVDPINERSPTLPKNACCSSDLTFARLLSSLSPFT